MQTGGVVPRGRGRDSQHSPPTPEAGQQPSERRPTIGAVVSKDTLSGWRGGPKERQPPAGVKAARHSGCDSRCGRMPARRATQRDGRGHCAGVAARLPPRRAALLTTVALACLGVHRCKRTPGGTDALWLWPTFFTRSRGGHGDVRGLGGLRSSWMTWQPGSTLSVLPTLPPAPAPPISVSMPLFEEPECCTGPRAGDTASAQPSCRGCLLVQSGWRYRACAATDVRNGHPSFTMF